MNKTIRTIADLKESELIKKILKNAVIKWVKKDMKDLKNRTIGVEHIIYRWKDRFNIKESELK